MRTLYIIWLILIAIPTALPITVVCCLAVIIGSALGGGRWWGHYPAMIWSRAMCILSLVRVKVIGRDNIDKHTSYVFVANHQGAYDIFSIYGYLGHSFKWMMKKSLRKVALIGYTCEKGGHIFVDRSSPAAIRKTIETAEDTLRDGTSLVVFPEGQRSPDGKMGPFKKGAYQLALEFKLPIVPITVNGSYAIMPRGTVFPHPGKITLTIHKPIAPPETETDRARVIEQTRETIAASLE